MNENMGGAEFEYFTYNTSHITYFRTIFFDWSVEIWSCSEHGSTVLWKLSYVSQSSISGSNESNDCTGHRDTDEQINFGDTVVCLSSFSFSPFNENMNAVCCSESTFRFTFVFRSFFLWKFEAVTISLDTQAGSAVVLTKLTDLTFAQPHSYSQDHPKHSVLLEIEGEIFWTCSIRDLD